MPRSGGGVYSLPAGSIVADGVDDILAAQHNDPLNDLALDMNTARPIVAGGTGATTASGARTALGLAVGTDVQAFDAGLASIAGLTTAADQMIYTTASDVYAVATLTAAGRAILDDADAAAQLVTLGAQPVDAALTSLATVGDTLVAGDTVYATGVNAVARLAKGTAGQVLKMNAGATAPEWVDGDGTTVGLLTTTGAATVGPWSLPAGVKRFTVTSRKSSLSGTGNILIQLRVAGSFVTSGYSSRSLAGSSGNVSSTAGMIVSVGIAANFWDGAMDFWLHDPATNLWLCRHTGSGDTTGSQTIIGSGDIALAGAVDGVQINSTAGTFDVSSFNVFY